MPIQNIPVYELAGNFEIYHLDQATDLRSLDAKAAHRRNDHYLFIFQRSGSSELLVDFRKISLVDCSITCIHPGQVHHAVLVGEPMDAWLLLVPMSAISHEYLAVFEQRYFLYKPIQPGINFAAMLHQTLALLSATQQETAIMQVKRSLLDASIGWFASAYAGVQPDTGALSRGNALTRSFRSLLLQHFKTHKRTGDYAALLAVTPSYLNEVVKATTGSPVTWWIQEVIIAEAKRQLCGTDNTIKEIAFQLGFDDQGHFARYFTRAAGAAPAIFRAQYRKTS
jgi:AraC-like DNA-binding protein